MDPIGVCAEEEQQQLLHTERDCAVARFTLERSDIIARSPESPPPLSHFHGQPQPAVFAGLPSVHYHGLVS